MVEIEVHGYFLARLGHRVVGVQVNVLVLDRLPQPLDKHVVAPAALAIHADADGMALQHADELAAGELAALIGIHDLRHAVFRDRDRKSTRLNSSHVSISYAVFCLKKKKIFTI